MLNAEKAPSLASDAATAVCGMNEVVGHVRQMQLRRRRFGRTADWSAAMSDRYDAPPIVGVRNRKTSVRRQSSLPAPATTDVRFGPRQTALLAEFGCWQSSENLEKLG